MIGRRHLLLGLGGLAACTKARTTPTWPRTATYEGVEMIELFPHDADETAPLIVAIHGKGDRPDRWVDEWRNFPARAQIVLPRAFDPHGGGFAWFQFKDGMTDEQFGAAVGAAEARLWKGIAKVAGTRRLIVTGFSQGGILSFAIASRHPNEVIHAFPVSGSCPGPLLPHDGAHSAPLDAFHGTTDQVLDIKWAREAVAAFKASGNEAALHEYEGVGHSISAKMHSDLWLVIRRVMPPPS